MAQIINTNIASLNAQRNLNNSQGANSQALERLSSGLRINSAKDDAAGLAISTRFESQTRGLGQAVRNAGDGVSLAQTAEGALSTITDNLQRMRELAVQSANGTNSDDDRVALQAEVKQLVAEIQRTSEETDFNGRSLFDGNFNGVFQIGANAGQTVGVQIGQLTTDRLGSSDQVGVSAIGTSSSIGNGDLFINGIAIGASQPGDDNASTSNRAASAIAKVETINRATAETGVTAYVNTNEVAGSEMTAPATGSNGEITLNGVKIDLSIATDTTATRASVAEAINAVSDQTGVTAVAGDANSKGVVLMAEDGRNIQIDLGDFSAEETGLAATGTYEGGYTLVANGDTKEITISGGNGTGIGDLANAGLVAGTYTRAVATSVSEKQALSGGESSFDLQGLKANSINDTAANLQLADAYVVSAEVGGASYSASVAAGGTVASLAGALNDIDGNGAVQAWEEIDATLSVNALEAGDDLTIGSTGITLTADDTTAAGLVDRLNSEDFSGSELTVQASLNSDGTIALNAKNFSGTAVAITSSATTTSLGVTVGDSPEVTVTNGSATVAGDLNFRSLDGSDMTASVTSAADPVTDNELFEAGRVAKSVDFTGVNGLDDGDITINGVTIGAAQVTADRASATVASDGSQILSSSKELSAIAIAASINQVSGSTGVEASVNATEIVGGDGSNVDVSQYSIGDSADLYINGVNMGAVTLQDDGNGQIDTDKAKSDALNLINSRASQTGVSGVDNGVSLTLTAADGRNVSIAIDNKGDGGTSFGALMGLDSAVEGIGEAKFGEVAAAQGAGPVGATTNVSSAALVGGDYSTASTTTINFAVSDGTNSFNAIIDDDSATPASIVGSINTQLSDNNVNVVADLNDDGELIFTATDVGSESTLTVTVGGDGAAAANLNDGAAVITPGSDLNVAGIEAQTYETTYGTVQLESAGQINIGVGSKGADEVEALGFRTGSFGGGEDGQFLKDVDVSTFEGATAAITAVDNALNTVSGVRSELGAIQNRFESTITNLEITRENLTAANSRIRDADFAAESAELSRTQVLQQAGISILAQANQRPQQALTLLG